MAKVEVLTPEKNGLDYSDAAAGWYVIDDEGVVFALVYNSAQGEPTRYNPTICRVTDPSQTWNGSWPSSARVYRRLSAGEQFKVTI